MLKTAGERGDGRCTDVASWHYTRERPRWSLSRYTAPVQTKIARNEPRQLRQQQTSLDVIDQDTDTQTDIKRRLQKQTWLKWHLPTSVSISATVTLLNNLALLTQKDLKATQSRNLHKISDEPVRVVSVFSFIHSFIHSFIYDSVVYLLTCTLPDILLCSLGIFYFVLFLVY